MTDSTKEETIENSNDEVVQNKKEFYLKKKHPSVIIFTALLLIFIGLIIIPDTNMLDSWHKLSTEFEQAKKIQDDNLRGKEYFRIIGDMTKLRDKHPYHGRLWVNLGYMYYYIARFDSAQNLAYQGLKIGGGGEVNRIDEMANEVFMKSTINMANAFYRNLDTASALNTFKNAYNMLPGQPALSKIIGSYFANFGSTDSAMFYLSKSLSLNQRDPETFYAIALSYYRSNKPDSAMIFLNQSLKLNPQYGDAQNLQKLIKK